MLHACIRTYDIDYENVLSWRRKISRDSIDIEKDYWLACRQHGESKSLYSAEKTPSNQKVIELFIKLANYVRITKRSVPVFVFARSNSALKINRNNFTLHHGDMESFKLRGFCNKT